MKKGLNLQNAKLVGGIIGITLFVALVAGFTYAWFTWRSSNIVVGGNTSCFDIDYLKGEDIIGANLKLFDESAIFPDSDNMIIKKGMVITNVSLALKIGCNIDAEASINLTISDLDSSYATGGESSSALRYAVLEYSSEEYPDITSDTLYEQTFKVLKKSNIVSTGKTNILDTPLPRDNTKKEYLIVFYVDGNTAVDASQNASFTARIDAEARQLTPSS